MVFRNMCKSKIHRATVTEANVHYEGSITIDAHLMDEAKLFPYERVQIANINTGVRLETYVIEGERHSGVIGMNGAAAKLAREGDEIHIISYGWYEENEAKSIAPTIIHLNKLNKISSLEKAAEIS